MAIPWLDLKAQIRRLLDDTEGPDFRWTDLQLLDFVGWSLDALCSHTAVITSTEIEVDGTTSSFILPDNVYEPIDRYGAVLLNNNGSQTYLRPVSHVKIATAQVGYYLLPADTLNMISSLSPGNQITVHYFAYYTHPLFDADLVTIPSWAVPAINYRVAAHAYSPLGGKSSNIRQWGQKPDTGRPTDNTLIAQTDWYMHLYECELAKAPPQVRDNYYQTGF